MPTSEAAALRTFPWKAATAVLECEQPKTKQEEGESSAILRWLYPSAFEWEESYATPGWFAVVVFFFSFECSFVEVIFFFFKLLRTWIICCILCRFYSVKMVFPWAFSFSNDLEEPQHVLSEENQASEYLEMHRCIMWGKMVPGKTCLGKGAFWDKLNCWRVSFCRS